MRQGGESFADHEILEMFLYGTRPRGDTNPVAHSLMDRFGNFKEIVNAEMEDLTEIAGVGTNTAFSIKLCREVCRRYLQSCQKIGTLFSGVEDVVTFLFPKYIGCTHEVLYLLLFNNRMNLLDCIRLSEGGITSTDLPLAKIGTYAIKGKASAVILAHNHPDGVTVPSINDLDATDSVYNLLNMLDISLLEHVIIAGDRFYPIMKYRMGVYRAGPIRTDQGASFYEHFYDLNDMEYTFSMTI